VYERLRFVLGLDEFSRIPMEQRLTFVLVNTLALVGLLVTFSFAILYAILGQWQALAFTTPPAIVYLSASYGLSRSGRITAGASALIFFSIAMIGFGIWSLGHWTGLTSYYLLTAVSCFSSFRPIGAG